MPAMSVKKCNSKVRFAAAQAVAINCKHLDVFDKFGTILEVYMSSSLSLKNKYF